MHLFLLLPLDHHLLFIPRLILHVILEHLFAFRVLDYHLLNWLILLNTLDLLAFPNEVCQYILERVFLLGLPAMHPVLLVPPSGLYPVSLLQHHVVLPVVIHLFAREEAFLGCLLVHLHEVSVLWLDWFGLLF